MSSLVQAKWVSSATGVEPELGELGAHQVLDGLHVVAGGRLEAASSSISGWPKSATHCRRARAWLGVERLVPNMPRSVRKISHSTSTCTRARLSPASDRCSPSASTAARYRPSSGLSG